MCTSISYKANDHYFGRNLDLEYSYNETVVITPRNYSFSFRRAASLDVHFSMIGMAFVVDGYPLYYDATNEHGLSMAGLNFPTNADYKEPADGKENITPFEFIPWILGRCKTVDEARVLLSGLNLINESFSEELPLSPLHWMIADKSKSIVVESVKDGLMIYDNPVGVMTNNPPFDKQLANLNNYMTLSAEEPKNTFAKTLELDAYSRGMGAIGLPGDMSSASRFVKAAFVLNNSVAGESEEEQVSQFFHILQSVEQPRGSVHLGGDKYEITIYSSCCNTAKGIYYYKTYENSQITAVDMRKENLDGHELIIFELIKDQQIAIEN